MNSYEEYLSGLFNKSDDILINSMRYAVFPGGKRLRSKFLIEAFKLFMDDLTDNRGETFSYPMASAIELIHSYSLVHDDLPAMDDDDFRRGKPSTHKEFGEGIAILTGDALLNLAYEIMTQSIFSEREEILKDRLIKSSCKVASYAGHRGMIGGQMIDITHSKDIEESMLTKMVELKTVALIMASVEAGIYLGHPSNAEIDLMKKFAYAYGMAFQIVDDIDDYEEDIDHKATFATCFGKEGAREKLEFFLKEANCALAEIERDTSFFKGQIDRLNA